METKQLFDLTEQEIQAIVEPVQAKLKEINSKSLEFTFTKTYESSSEKEDKTARFVLKGSVGNADSAALTQLVESVKAQLAPYGEKALLNRTEVTFTIGEKCPDVEKVEVIPSKEAKTFTCPPGEVTLIDFWATWCGPCQKPMAHNQEMLEKNEEKWKGKARIVGVSLDDSMDAVIKRIEEKKWNKIEHYWSPGAWESVSAKRFGLRGIPHVLLVDKEGKIAFVGHPSECDLEAKINELIEGVQAKPEGDKKDEDKKPADDAPKPAEKEHKDIAWKDQDEIFKIAEAEHKAFPKDMPHVKDLKFVIQVLNKYSKDKHVSEGNIRYLGLCTSEDTAPAVEYGKKLLAKFPRLEKNSQLGKRVLPEVKFGTTCGACKSAISQDAPHYVCTTCLAANSADYAFCAECADKEMKQDDHASPKDLFHPHGLLFIEKNTPLESLKELKRQFNVTETSDESESWYAEWKASKQAQGVYCDGCEGPIKGYRWACAHCDNFDYCPDCYHSSKDPSHANYEKIAKGAKEAGGGHDLAKHLFYRANYLINISPATPTPIEVKE